MRIAVLMGAAASSSARDALPANAIECRMQAPAQVTSGAPVPLRFELISHSPRRLKILTWNTPLEGWFGNYLRVTASDREIAYRGPQAKRGAPEAGDYVWLAPSRKLQAEVDLSQVYALSAPGRYRIAFTGWLHDVATGRPQSARMPYSVTCPAIELDVLG